MLLFATARGTPTRVEHHDGYSIYSSPGDDCGAVHCGGVCRTVVQHSKVYGEEPAGLLCCDLIPCWCVSARVFGVKDFKSNNAECPHNNSRRTDFGDASPLRILRASGVGRHHRKLSRRINFFIPRQDKAVSERSPQPSEIFLLEFPHVFGRSIWEGLNDSRRSPRIVLTRTWYLVAWLLQRGVSKERKKEKNGWTEHCTL